MTSLVLITGPSGCGKSSIAKGLLQHQMENKRINDSRISSSLVLLHQDNYFVKEFIDYKFRTDDSYEDESGIDWNKLTQDMVYKANNEEVTLVVVEGHILSSSILSASVLEKYDQIYIIIISCEKDICKLRRINRRLDRNVEEQRDLELYYDKYVWPSFLKHGKNAIQSLHGFLDKEKKNKNSGKISLLELDNNRNTCGEILYTIEAVIKHVE
jgi:uridine kinase